MKIKVFQQKDFDILNQWPFFVYKMKNPKKWQINPFKKILSGAARNGAVLALVAFFRIFSKFYLGKISKGLLFRHQLHIWVPFFSSPCYFKINIMLWFDNSKTKSDITWCPAILIRLERELIKLIGKGVETVCIYPLIRRMMWIWISMSPQVVSSWKRMSILP